MQGQLSQPSKNPRKENATCVALAISANAHRDHGSCAIALVAIRPPASGERSLRRLRAVATTVKGSRKEGEKRLGRLLRTVDVGEHVAPDKITLTAWAEHWIGIGCPGQRRRKVGQLSQERYAQLLRMYVLPVLGGLKLQ